MLAGFCRECGEKMKKVLHFEEGTSYSYSYCKKCNYQTKPKKIMYVPDENNAFKTKAV